MSPNEVGFFDSGSQCRTYPAPRIVTYEDNNNLIINMSTSYHGNALLTNETLWVNKHLSYRSRSCSATVMIWKYVQNYKPEFKSGWIHTYCRISSKWILIIMTNLNISSKYHLSHLFIFVPFLKPITYSVCRSITNTRTLDGFIWVNLGWYKWASVIIPLIRWYSGRICSNCTFPNEAKHENTMISNCWQACQKGWSWGCAQPMRDAVTK